MPYKRRRNYRRKRPVKKTGVNWSGIAKTALKTAKWVASVVNVEYKYFITTSSLTQVNWAGTLWNLCMPAQGTTALQRTGDSLKMKDLTLRLNIDYTSVAECVRVIIFIDKQNVVSAGSDFLQYTGVYLVTDSEKKEDNKYDTQTLFDKTFSVSQYKPQVKFTKVLKLNRHTNFDAGTTTINSNSLKMLIYSQNVGAGTSKVSFISRCSYVDN